MTAEEVLALISAPEHEHLECKSGRNAFDFEKLARYVSALANERGGVVLIGVSDTRPRTIVGSAAFDEPGRTAAGLYQALGVLVSVSEHFLEGGRVVAVSVASRPAGRAIAFRGAYWMRAGEALVPMSDERLREIHREVEPDFSSEICPSLQLADLEQEAIEGFRRRWLEKSGNTRLQLLNRLEVLTDAGLIHSNGGVSYAALLLFGTRASVSRFLPSAELIYEFRNVESAGPAQLRLEFKEGFLLTADPLWSAIDARNDRQSIQEGFFRRDIPTFDEKVIREAILNAVTHRDYRDQRSIFVRQYSRRMEVVSPGGFPGTVTEANILTQQHPRNRLLAEAFSRIGLVERAGQGVNLMVERSIQQGKRPPNFSNSTPHEVFLVLDGAVASTELAVALEKLGEEQLRSFSTDDFVVLGFLQRGEPVPESLRDRLPALKEIGVLESQGRGRSVRYFLSRRVSAAIGQSGAYTRRRGLDRETHRQILLKHLRDSGVRGCSLQELEQVIPGLSRSQIQTLLSELREESQIHLRGLRRWARWFHGATPN